MTTAIPAAAEAQSDRDLAGVALDPAGLSLEVTGMQGSFTPGTALALDRGGDQVTLLADRTSAGIIGVSPAALATTEDTRGRL